MMRSLFTICLFLLFIPCGKASQRFDSLAFKYAQFIHKDQLSKHLHVLASNAFEGRETAKEGQKKAARYIADFFASIGIKPCIGDSYFQKFNVLERAPRGTIVIGNKRLTYAVDFYYIPGFKDTSFVLTDLMLLGYGIHDSAYSDYGKMDVRGKVLLFLDGEPYAKGKSLVSKSKFPSAWTTDNRKKAQYARQRGAAAVFLIKDNFKESSAYARHFLEKPPMILEMDTATKDYQNTRRRIPTFYLSPETSYLLFSQADQNEMKKYIQRKRKSQTMGLGSSEEIMRVEMKSDDRRLETENVLGYIEGDELKNELIVLTAHYDHIGVENGVVFNGADDDGTGTVALMQIAEAFMQAKKAGIKTKRSILVMLVSGEEKGLLGSSYYVENPVFPLKNTIVNLNIDMIGRRDTAHWNRSDYVYLIGSDILSKELHAISEAVNATYSQLTFDYTYNNLNDPNRYYYRSDHYNFAKKNIPVIFYFNGVHADYHQPTDDVEKIEFEKVEKIARLVFYTTWDLANREKRPELNP